MPKFRQDELEHIHQAYQAGRELADAGFLEDAIAYFDRVLGRLPRRRRDRVYRIEGNTVDPRLKGIHWLPPIFRDALLAKVYCLNELGRFSDAYPLLERAVELDPENPQVYAEIGYAHGAQANMEMARAAYLRAADLEPQNADHLRSLAHLALLSEDYEEAIALSEQALRMEPASLASLHQLAYAKYRLGNMTGAIHALEHAVALAPFDRESVLRLVGTLREVGRFRDAIRHMDNYLQTEDDDPEVIGVMTDLLQQDGSAPQIFTHSRRMLQRNPRDPHALDLLAWGYYQQGDLREALDILRRLVILEPMQAHHHYKLGMIYETMGALPLALSSLMRAVALDSQGDVGQMATDAISNLDQVQIEQILHRFETDVVFRFSLQRDAEQALMQAGYLLSPMGMQMLLSLDLNGDGMPLLQRSHTVH